LLLNVSSLLATADPFASLKEKNALKARNYRKRQKEALQELPDEARAIVQTTRKV